MARARQREVVSRELAFLTAKLVEICIEQGILWSIETHNHPCYGSFCLYNSFHNGLTLILYVPHVRLWSALQ